jgi:hypothetical protein
MMSLEQKFKQAQFERDVAKMSREQAQEFLIHLHKLMLERDNCFKQILKQELLGG